MGYPAIRRTTGKKQRRLYIPSRAIGPFWGHQAIPKSWNPLHALLKTPDSYISSSFLGTASDPYRIPSCGVLTMAPTVERPPTGARLAAGFEGMWQNGAAVAGYLPWIISCLHVPS